jgi:hypothetical protein
MATAVKSTPSMQAHAEVLLERASRWARGIDKSNGQAFVTFTSSRTDREGNPIYHKTHAAGLGCTCPSWLHRGSCSHALACQIDAERQAWQAENDAIFAGFERHDVEPVPALPEPVAAPRKSYADLFPPEDDDLGLVDAY